MLPRSWFHRNRSVLCSLHSCYADQAIFSPLLSLQGFLAMLLPKDNVTPCSPFTGRCIQEGRIASPPAGIPHGFKQHLFNSSRVLQLQKILGAASAALSRSIRRAELHIVENSSTLHSHIAHYRLRGGWAGQSVQQPWQNIKQQQNAY